MLLKELLKGVEVISLNGCDEIQISGISYDSRKTAPGHLFVAMQGGMADGHNFICDAANKGATAVLFDRDIGLDMPVCFIRVRDSRRALASVASSFYHHPSQGMTVTGITGTNGKTTTTYILKAILEAWGKKVGLIGTIQYMIDDEVCQATHTTPESPEFQSLLNAMLKAGCSHVVTEVSSHALSQHRVDNTEFRAGIFTNLTRDHLDFHGTMDEYYRSKERFFAEFLDSDATAVINNDDEWGRRLSGSIGCRICSYGLGHAADLTASDIENTFDGLRFRLGFSGEYHEVVSPLVGLPNVYNILAAAGAALSVGAPFDAIIEGIRKLPAIRGRFEKVYAGQKFLAVVDYAHTEDALERLIHTARAMTKGRVITVFGCGGDRDSGKRPRMGETATRLSDFVVITSDNPRSESPEDIIRQIEAGAAGNNYITVTDRQEAIRRAVLMSGEDDVLLVAGKGHETYQEIGGRRYPFNDREVLEASIRDLISKR